MLGESNIKKADLQILSLSKEDLKIRNEADLYNKARIIKQEIELESEKLKEKIKFDKIKIAREILDAEEPAFLLKEDRLMKIKGEIVSALNRAIRNREIASLDDLKRLIEKLELELSDI